MFASGYNGDDLHDAYRDVAVLQKLYDIAEFKAVLTISLMEEDSQEPRRQKPLAVSATANSCATECLA
jgi:hypothetical protein